MCRNGIRTTEFALSLIVVVLGALQVAGVLGEGTIIDKLSGAVVAVLAQLGYGAMRVKLKLAAPAAAPSAEAAPAKPAEEPQEPAEEPAGGGGG